MTRRKKWIMMVLAGAFGLVLLALASLGYVVRGPIVLNVPEGSEGRPVSAERLKETVRILSTDLAPRFYESPESLDRVADWIADRFRDTGLEVTEQSYQIQEVDYRNVIATRLGSAPDLGVVIIGAHYDAAGGLPGADDNASGVAAVLELARTLPQRQPRRTQLFVAFSTEEPPFFSTEDMGSYHFARKLAEDGTRVDLMIALDLVGYFSDEPGSQSFPGNRRMRNVMRLFYPSEGNFISVVGDLSAGRWIGRVKRGMRSANALPVLSMRGPASAPGVLWSDHLWFRRFGLPGVMITDTAFNRNPHYHQPTDTPETLDYVRMASVVQALHGLLQDE